MAICGRVRCRLVGLLFCSRTARTPDPVLVGRRGGRAAGTAADDEKTPVVEFDKIPAPKSRKALALSVNPDAEASGQALPLVTVAIPMLNEEQRIGACL